MLTASIVDSGSSSSSAIDRHTCISNIYLFHLLSNIILDFKQDVWIFVVTLPGKGKNKRTASARKAVHSPYSLLKFGIDTIG